jgi:hypothetical protein
MKDTRLKVVFTILFIASSLGGLMVTGLVFGWGPIGLWGGLVVGGLFGTLLGLGYMKLRGTESTRKVLRPGEAACPACGSLQTDIVEESDPSGRVIREWTCFACDHRWEP